MSHAVSIFGRSVAVCVIAFVTGAVASPDEGAVYGIAVAISLVTSVVGTLATLGIIVCVRKLSKGGERADRSTCSDRSDEAQLPAPGQAWPDRVSVTSSSRSLVRKRYDSVPAREPRVELTPNGVEYFRSVSSASSATDRRRSDYVSKWCTEHQLTEETACVLRGKGFTYERALSSLKPSNVKDIGLKDYAQECILRDIVEKRDSARLNSHNSQGTLNVSTGSRKRSNSTDECRGLDEPDCNTALLDKSRSVKSVNHVDEPDAVVSTGRLRKKSSMDSMELLEERTKPYAPEPRPRLTSQRSTQYSPTNGIPKENVIFHGMLSDTGLYNIARKIGAEWPHLATLLGVSVHEQEQIRMDYPGNTFQQIAAMLRYWRDRSSSSNRYTKQEIKGFLHDALQKCNRKDVAEILLQETIHGSNETVRYHSII